MEFIGSKDETEARSKEPNVYCLVEWYQKEATWRVYNIKILNSKPAIKIGLRLADDTDLVLRLWDGKVEKDGEVENFTNFLAIEQSKISMTVHDNSVQFDIDGDNTGIAFSDERIGKKGVKPIVWFEEADIHVRMCPGSED
jgi:hypothetical protein